MRSLISLLVAVLLTLTAVSTGRAAGQSRKSKAKARVSHRASKSKARTTPTARTTPATVAMAEVETRGDGVRRITPVDARQAVAQGRAVIIDVRGEDSYNAGHIKGARWINLNDIGSRAGELPRDKMIITYCS